MKRYRRPRSIVTLAAYWKHATVFPIEINRARTHSPDSRAEEPSKIYRVVETFRSTLESSRRNYRANGNRSKRTRRESRVERKFASFGGVAVKRNDGSRDGVRGLKRPRYRGPFRFFFSPMTLTIFEVIDTNTPVATCTVQDLDM